MKNRNLIFLAAITLLGFSLTAFGAEKFSGVVMDSQCAMMGSHAKMEGMNHMAASSSLTGKTARMCTVACVKMGGHFVLYDHASNKTYKLDPEDGAKPYAADRVTVSGTLDGDTIHVTKISKRM